MKTNRIVKKPFLVRAAVTLMLCMVLLGGCGNPQIDISGYQDETLTLSGIVGEDGQVKTVEYTISEIAAMEAVTKKTSSTSDKIGEVNATGVLLATLVAESGADLTDYHKVTFYASDEYEITLYQDFFLENQLILAYGIDGDPLGKGEAPLRLIIPDSDSAYWIRMVDGIKLEK